MKIVAVSTVAAILFMMNGCATQNNLPKSSVIQFNYSIENAKEAGLIQVFDMTGNTVMQVKDIELRRPLFLDANDKPITYKVIGQYASFNGVHNYIRVIANNAYALVTRNNFVHPVPAGSPIVTAGTQLTKPDGLLQVDAPKGKSMADASPKEIQNEITRLKQELADIKSILAKASESSNNNHQEIAESKERKSETIMRVTFKLNSFKFEPKADIKRMLVNVAKDASEIDVHGYTDSSVTTKQGEMLANKRAIETKKYLVANGIANHKINLFYEPSGHFISDNNTINGRNENRRVEIAMR